MRNTQLLRDLFEAYYDCRRNKRNTANAIEFEIDYESRLMALHEEIENRTYSVGKSIAFIVEKPVKREIFAGDFRDRVIHHHIIRKLNPIFEKIFIHDSYSCRKGKGTLFGIRRIDSFIRSATENYQKDAYVLKLDIEGFFMSIDRTILLSQICRVIDTKYVWNDREELLWLCEKVVRNDPTTNCVIKGPRENWIGLPRTKSLFFSASGVGLPIGNLTSQIFANLYLHPLDDFVKRTLKIRYYGRYVDDFVLVHEDGEYLKRAIGEIRSFLSEDLRLSLHPRKVYFQHFSKGVPFLWAFVKPHRTYVGNRTKSNFAASVRKWNDIAGTEGIPESETPAFLASANSYLGLLGHFDAFRLRKKFVTARLSPEARKGFLVGKDSLKLTVPPRKKTVHGARSETLRWD